MQKKQTTSKLLTGILPKVSIFDRKGQVNLSRFTKLPNMPQKSERVSIPTVRINQHKGA